MKTVMVIGATGTLGTYLVDELHEKGYSVWAIGARNVNEDYYRRRGMQCASVDIVNRIDFDKLPTHGIDAVIQIAGAMPSRMVGYKPETYLRVNILGTLNVLDFCVRTKVKSYLFTQSHSDVAYLWNTGKHIRPDAVRRPVYVGDHAVYSISKNTAVDLAEHFNQQFGLNTFIFRLPTVYSYRPISDMYVNGNKVPIGYRQLIKKAINSETVEIWGDPRRGKDIVYVKDFTQILIKAIESDKNRGFYNVATGTCTTLDEQIRGIVEVFSPRDRPSKIVYKPEKTSQNSYFYDIENARTELGYEPEFHYIKMLHDIRKEMNGNRFDHLRSAIVEI